MVAKTLKLQIKPLIHSAEGARSCMKLLLVSHGAVSYVNDIKRQPKLWLSRSS